MFIVKLRKFPWESCHSSRSNEKEEIISLESGGGIVVDLQIFVTSATETFGQPNILC